MHTPDFDIGSIKVSAVSAPFVIAEIGSNHDGSLDKAKELVQSAADAGAAAVKFQLFHPEDLYPAGTDTHALLAKLALPEEWLPDLKSAATTAGVEFLASAFCGRCVDALEDVGVPAHKLASSEVTNLSLVLRMARTGKPLLLSTGMSELADVARAEEVCRGVGNTSLTIMQCTSLYPTSPTQVHLRAMAAMRETFGRHVGLSDHTSGFVAAVGAVALGARVIEKHLTLNRSSPGPDHSYAAEPDELERLCAAVEEAAATLGDDRKTFLDDERSATRRAGLYVAENVRAGTPLIRDVLLSQRPALGITAELADAVVGAEAAEDIPEGSPLMWRNVSMSSERQQT